MTQVVPPVVNRDDQYFWDGVQDDRLLVRSCAGCRHVQHPLTPMCPKCGSVTWDTRQLSGKGTLNSWIVSRHPTEPDEEPRMVALIDLDEGLRLVSNLQDIDPADVENDMRLEVLFTEVDGVKLPQFRPAREGA